MARPRPLWLRLPLISHRVTLRPGQRLPTHRELAFRLGIAVATVTKAYTEAKRHGYLRTGVGDGTFVLEPLLAARRRIRRDDVTTDGIDLSFNTPITTLGQDATLAETLERLGHDSTTVRSLLDYHRPWSGRDHHRRIGVAWLDALGIAANPEDVTVTCGAQHAACIALLSNLSAGDILLTEELTDPLTKFLATTLRFELRSVRMDEQGLCIKALGEACRGGRARGLLCMPDHQSPTAVVMPEARRRAIAELARRHDLMILENAVYRPLVPDAPPPISALAPERSFVFSSFSKIIAPGLRTGFLVAPPGRTRDLILGLGADQLDGLTDYDGDRLPLDRGRDGRAVGQSSARGIASSQQHRRKAARAFPTWRAAQRHACLAHFAITMARGRLRPRVGCEWHDSSAERRLRGWPHQRAARSAHQPGGRGRLARKARGRTVDDRNLAHRPR